MSEKKLTKGDRFNMFMRTNLQQASFNYERMHALGMCFDMVPAIKRLYDTKEEQKEAMNTYTAFFNTEPQVGSIIVGITAGLEEAKANGNEDIVCRSDQWYPCRSYGTFSRYWRYDLMVNINVSVYLDYSYHLLNREIH